MVIITIGCEWWQPTASPTKDPNEAVFIEEMKNLCYVQPEDRWDPDNEYIHTYFDENWICNRCWHYIGPKYDFTEDDIYLLAQLLCGDASISGDGEYDFVSTYKEPNYYEISKVLCVVMNRVRNATYANAVKEVVLQKGQFVVMPRNLNTTPHDIAIEKVREWCEAYDRYDNGVQVIPKNNIYFEAGPNLTNVTRAIY